MTTDQTKKTGVTLMDLVANGIKKSELKDGVYDATYQRHDDRKTKYGNRSYFQHSFDIKVDDGNTTLLVDSGRQLKKGHIPKYNTKLFNIVSALLGCEPKNGETIYLEDLIGLKCKVSLNGDEVSFASVDNSSAFEEISKDKKP